MTVRHTEINKELKSRQMHLSKRNMSEVWIVRLVFPRHQHQGQAVNELKYVHTVKKIKVVKQTNRFPNGFS